jgi:HEAT repeat protein
MTKRKPISAGELVASLAKDPEYQERVRQRDEKIRMETERLARAQAPLVEEMRAAGADVNNVWDLINTDKKHPELVPILLAHLDKDYPDRVREGIARALSTVREARTGWDQLVRAYRKDPSPTDWVLGVSQVKWALHLAIATAADVSVLDELIQLAADRRHGRHRSFFVDALAAIDDPRAQAALEELKDDPDLSEGYLRLSKKNARRRK